MKTDVEVKTYTENTYRWNLGIWMDIRKELTQGRHQSKLFASSLNNRGRRKQRKGEQKRQTHTQK